MKVGSFTLEILSEGRFEFFDDGHINRVPASVTPTSNSISDKYNQTMSAGINPILIQTPDHNILLDTGLGWGLDAGTPNTDVSNVRTNLRIFGLNPEHITHVMLSHLHYDHVAGSVYTDSSSHVQPTFPNATYFVHEKEWDFALQQQGKKSIFGEQYKLDDLYKLISREQLVMLKGRSTEIAEGVTTCLSGGHTPGHQIVVIQDDQKKAYYLGDLLPTEFQLNEYAMEAFDVHSLQAKKQKIRRLKRVHQEKALLLFYHSQNGQAGHLLQDKDHKYVLAKQLPC